MTKLLSGLFAMARMLVNVLLLFIVILISLLVILRGTIGYSIKWAEEISLVSMMWITFLTMALGIREDIHIRIEMFVTWLPRRAKVALEYFLNTVLLFISVMMIYYGGMLTKFAMLHRLPATRFPSAVTYIIIPAVGVVCMLQLLVRLIKGPNSET